MKNEAKEKENERRGTSALTRLLCRFLPLKNKAGGIVERDWPEPPVPKINKFKECENFANIGDEIKYLGKKVIITGYHYFYFGYRTNTRLPGLEVEWFDKNNRLNQKFIEYRNLSLCKKC